MEIINPHNLLKTKKTLLDKEQWSKLITEWKNSTESQREFCKRLNLNINTFTYIKSKLEIKNKQKKFIPLTIRQNISPAPILNVILENAKGIKLHFTSTMDDNLIQLLKIVGW